MSPIFRCQYFRLSHFGYHSRQLLVMHFISAHFPYFRLLVISLRFDHRTFPQIYSLISLILTRLDSLQVSTVEFYVCLDFGQIKELQIVFHVLLNFLWKRFEVIC